MCRRLGLGHWNQVSFRSFRTSRPFLSSFIEVGTFHRLVIGGEWPARSVMVAALCKALTSGKALRAVRSALENAPHAIGCLGLRGSNAPVGPPRKHTTTAWRIKTVSGARSKR
jgi:hypothetical protein